MAGVTQPTTLRPATVRPLVIGPHRVPTPVVLAPMAGVTNAAFRRLCRRYGAGLYVSEMVNARGLVEGGTKSWDLAAFDPGALYRRADRMRRERRGGGVVERAAIRAADRGAGGGDDDGGTHGFLPSASSPLPLAGGAGGGEFKESAAFGTALP